MTKTINFERILQYSERAEKELDDEYAEIMEIPQAEVDELEQEQEQDAVKDGIFEILSQNEHVFYNMTGFNTTEFAILSAILIPHLESNGRGRKRTLLPNDIITLLLYYFRHYPRYEDINSLFGIPESTFKGILTTYLPKIKEVLEHEFIIKYRADCDVTYDQDFPECGFAVDATVQEILVPSRSFEYAKQFYSQKHKIYCLKSQVIVTLKGVAVHVVTGIKGSVHDKKVFDESIDDFTNEVINPRIDDIPSKILGDKGYQDKNSDILITPYKGEPRTLERQQRIFNEKLGKIRVIVENFFGRLKIRYGVIRDPFRGDQSIYPMLFITCCALVNFEITVCDHPLRQEFKYYVRQVTQITTNAIQRSQNMAKKRKAYKERRMERKTNEDPDLFPI